MATEVDLGFDREQLAGLIEAIKENPEIARTVWRAKTRWRQGFQSEATIPREGGPGYTIPMDEPAALGGSDTAPNMVEMVLGAYGCCLTTGLVAGAWARGIKLEGVEIELEGDIDLRSFLGLKDPDELSAGYSDIRAKVTLNAPGTTPEQLQELYRQVVRTSPVGSTIARSVGLRTELAIPHDTGD